MALNCLLKRKPRRLLAGGAAAVAAPIGTLSEPDRVKPLDVPLGTPSTGRIRAATAPRALRRKASLRIRKKLQAPLPRDPPTAPRAVTARRVSARPPVRPMVRLLAPRLPSNRPHAGSARAAPRRRRAGRT